MGQEFNDKTLSSFQQMTINRQICLIPIDLCIFAAVASFVASNQSAKGWITGILIPLVILFVYVSFILAIQMGAGITDLRNMRRIRAIVFQGV